MSGIAGLFNGDGRPVESVELAAMLTPLAHRGPDGSRQLIAGAVGLGHLLLRTTPEARHEAQPLRNRRGDLVLTADARIDNRADLCAALSPGEQPTDAELILAAYERWGQDCPRHLLGDFAFALYDAGRRELFCARDHLGVKPFYYYHAAQRFAFASEIKALLALPGVPVAVNDARVAEYLCLLESEDRAATFYRGIMRLPPGHSMSVSSAGLHITRYWALDPRREIRLRSHREYAEQFGAIFAEAVRCRLRSDNPVGVILSGGLDSASVAATARAIRPAGLQIHTLSAYFDGADETDERPYIDALLAGGGLIGHRIDGNRIDMALDELERIVRQVEEPFWFPFLLVKWRLYGLARESGVRVLLDGTDGDSTVAALHPFYMPELLRRGHLLTFLSEINGWVRRGKPESWRRYLEYWAELVGEYGVDPLLIKPLKEYRRRRAGHARPLPALLNRAAARPANLEERLGRYPRVGFEPGLAVRAAHYARLANSVFSFHLEMLDRAAAAFGLEYRHPFFDKRLLEFCLALPGGQRFHQGETRTVMRRGLRRYLPPAITARLDKGGVAHHYQRTLMRDAAPQLTARILNGAPALYEYVDRAVLEGAYRRYLSGDSSAADGANAWLGASLALWLNSWQKSGKDD